MEFFILIHSVSGLVCLQNLIDKGYKPALIIMHKSYEREKLQKDFFTPVEKLCITKKIPLIQTDTPREIINKIKNFQIGFCVGYMKILRKDFFQTPEYGIFNLHCGKLPEYRGRAPISRTIMNGDKELIATIHKIDEGVDSGPIAVEVKIKITLKDDVNSLYKKFSENSYKGIVEVINKVNTSKLKLRKQKSIRKKSYSILSEDECRINWKKNDLEIFNKVRALKSPYPQAFSILHGKKYFFNNAMITGIKSKNVFGKIEKITNKSMFVNTRNELLKISEIYTESAKIIPSKEFKIGERFI